MSKKYYIRYKDTIIGTFLERNGLVTYHPVHDSN